MNSLRPRVAGIWGVGSSLRNGYATISHQSVSAKCPSAPPSLLNELCGYATEAWAAASGKERDWREASKSSCGSILSFIIHLTFRGLLLRILRHDSVAYLRLKMIMILVIVATCKTSFVEIGRGWASFRFERNLRSQY